MNSLINNFSEDKINKKQIEAVKPVLSKSLKLDYNKTPSSEMGKPAAPTLFGHNSENKEVTSSVDYGSVGTGLVNMFQQGYSTANNPEADDVGLATNALSMTATGATTGMAVGGPIGAGIGAGVGLLGGVFSGISSRKKNKEAKRKRYKEIEEMKKRTSEERERNNRIMEGQQQIEAESAIRQQQLGLINNY